MKKGLAVTPDPDSIDDTSDGTPRARGRGRGVVTAHDNGLTATHGSLDKARSLFEAV